MTFPLRPRGRGAALGLGLLLAPFVPAIAAGCDDGYEPPAPLEEVITVPSLRAERLGSGGENVFFLTLQFRNDSASSTRVILGDVKVAVGSTSAEFEIDGLRTYDCGTKVDSPWQPRPGEARETRMRLDLRGDTSRLDVGCENVPGGFDAFNAQSRESPRSGPELPPGATGTLQLELTGSLILSDTDDQPHYIARATTELPP
ncbi:MAG: hypothetical protein MUF34_36020 [Polyangiaceae bacterium]|jgi:hypothetical protein|nr:hypothetical protein [Polyangiaceae bacterium]